MFNQFKLNISLTQLCSKVTGIYGCVEFKTLSLMHNMMHYVVSIVLIIAHMHMYTRNNSVQYRQGRHNRAAWAETQEVNSSTLWRQQERDIYAA